MGERSLQGQRDGSVVTVDTRDANDVAADMKVAFDIELAKGMPYGGKILQVDDAAILRICAVQTAVNAGVPFPGNFAWRMADNSMLPLTQAQFLDMATRAFNHVQGLRLRMWTAVDAAAAAGTPADTRKVRF